MIYTTADFDGQQAADHTLLIGVGATMHTLAVVDHVQQLKFAASYDPTAPADEIATLLDLGFGTVKLAIADSRYTFIPADVYDEQHRDTYLHYLPFDGVGDTHVDDISTLGIKLLHQTSRVGAESIVERFPQAARSPVVQARLAAVAPHAIKANGPVLVVDRQALWIAVGVFDHGKFLYCHDFECDNDDDFTYHLLAIMDRFGFAERQPKIYLSGEIDQSDVYVERAVAYGSEAVLADSGSWTGVGVPGDFLPHQHRFLTLFGLQLCG